MPDDTTEPWNGRHLDLPAHIHVPVLGSSLSTSTAVSHSAFEFEFLLNEGSDHEWILNLEQQVAVPMAGATWQSPWGMPTAAPEVILFYKAGGNLTSAEISAGLTGLRARDEDDFVALLPTLTGVQRGWLRDSLALVLPEHPWLPQLGA